MIKAQFAGNKKVSVKISGFDITTDLPEAMGGDNSAPNPFDLFLAAFSACTATYVMLYMDKQGINKDGVSVQIEPVLNEDGLIQKADVLVYVPAAFPKDKEPGLIKMVQHCKVGSHLNFPHDVIIVR